MKPAGPIGLGLIGCGGIAYWVHLRELRGNRAFRLIAAADPDPKARERAQALTQASIVTDAKSVLQHPEVTAVLVATPSGTHAQLAIAAAKAGKAIYLEKPLATSLSGGREVAAAVREAGVQTMVGFNRRFHPSHVRARRWLQEGRLGRVQAIQTCFTEFVEEPALPGWKRSRASGGGVLLDLGSHHFDLLRWFLGTEPTEVRARIESRRSEHDTAWVDVQFADGVTAQCHFSFHAGPSDTLEFQGEHGTLRVDRHRAWPEWRRRRPAGYGLREVWPVRSWNDLAVWTRQRLRPGFDPSYRLALEAFAAGIGGHGKSGATGATISDGLASLAMVEAAEASAAMAGSTTPVQTC